MKPVHVLTGPRLDHAGTGPGPDSRSFSTGHRSSGNDLIHLAKQAQPLFPDVAFVAPHGPEAIGGARRWFELSSANPAGDLARRVRSESLARPLPR